MLAWGTGANQCAMLCNMHFMWRVCESMCCNDGVVKTEYKLDIATAGGEIKVGGGEEEEEEECLLLHLWPSTPHAK